MRRLLIALAVVLLPSFAIAHGHGGGHGGMGGTGAWPVAGALTRLRSPAAPACARGTVTWLPGTVVPATGTAFIMAISYIATAESSSSAALGGADTATMITVAGSGSRRDGDRNGSGSAAATTR